MTDPSTSSPRVRFGRPAGIAFGAGLLTLGAVGGAIVTAETRPSAIMAPARPTPIASLSSAGIVTIRGRVAEIYGNKFVMADGTGRALVDTGPQGDRDRLVGAGEPVTVQGRFDHGFVHAAFLVGPDGKVTALGPLAPPRGPHDGPDHGPAAPPPPGPAGSIAPVAGTSTR